MYIYFDYEEFVNVIVVTCVLATVLGLQACDDIVINGVLIGYPAHKAGLLDNDKILKVNHHPMI